MDYFESDQFKADIVAVYYVVFLGCFGGMLGLGAYQLHESLLAAVFLSSVGGAVVYISTRETYLEIYEGQFEGDNK